MREITLGQAIRVCGNINELTGIYANIMDVKRGMFHLRPFMSRCPLKTEECAASGWNREGMCVCPRGLSFLSKPVDITGHGKALLSVGPFIVSDSGETAPKGSKASGLAKYTIIHITTRQLEALNETMEGMCACPPVINEETEDCPPVFSVEQEFISGGSRADRLVSGNSLIRRLSVYIYQHLDEELDLNWALKYTHFSKSYLCRIFKKELNTTFRDYVNVIRVEQSKLYLKNRNYRISEIARLTGFSDQNYFSRIFKRYEGVTPSQYRKKQS